MKRFEELHINDQNTLLVALLETITRGKGKSISEVAIAQGITEQEFWRQICADAGFDECEPWQGFPAPPVDLPPAPGGERKLPEAAAEALEQWENLSPKRH
jgi:hypothetical protein